MLKSYSYLFLCLFLLSCGKSGSGGGSDQKQDSVNVGTDSELSNGSGPAPTAAQTWDANIKFVNFSKTQEEKVLDAVDLMKQVIASDEFKERVINYKYKGKKQFADNGGLSNAQVYRKILEGSEKLKPGKNNAMDITLETYFVNANVIGYTLPSVNTIWMNRKYFNNFTPVQVASNMTHEWLHKLGFKHDYESTPKRPFTVPYAIGYIMKSLAAKFY